MSYYGTALAERREQLGFRSTSDVARISVEVAEHLDDPQFAPFSQQTLSRLQADDTGKLISNARPATLRTLSCILRWRASRFQHHVGVGIPEVSKVLTRNGKLLTVPDKSETVEFNSLTYLSTADLWYQATQYAMGDEDKTVVSVDVLELENTYGEAIATFRDGTSILLVGSYLEFEDEQQQHAPAPATIPPELRQAAQSYGTLDPLILETPSSSGWPTRPSP